jgi:hypothetical protein
MGMQMLGHQMSVAVAFFASGDWSRMRSRIVRQCGGCARRAPLILSFFGAAGQNLVFTRERVAVEKWRAPWLPSVARRGKPLRAIR